MGTHKDALFQKIYELGFAFERDYRGCAQCVIAALQDGLSVRNHDTDVVFKCATALAGGVARQTDGHCGAYSGGVMMISHYVGRERSNFADPQNIRATTTELASKLHRRFIDEYGTVTCSQIHTKIMGRPFYISDPDEKRKFDEAGAHADKCPGVVGRAARWTAEILAEAGLIHP